jgi:hypothetical protein
VILNIDISYTWMKLDTLVNKTTSINRSTTSA